jgi:ATP-binding cassette, subfamily B (MDR/TAP), member 1
MTHDPEKSARDRSDSEVSTRLPESPKEKESNGSAKDYFRAFKYADKIDWALYALAWTMAVVSGAALPLMSLVFGTFTTKFNNFSTGQSSPKQFKNDVDHFVLWFIYLFVGKLFTTYIATASANIAATRTTRSLRKAFLASVLRQELWYFDNKSNGAISTQVTTNGNKIQSGIAEKLVFMIQGVAMFMSAIVIAIARQWKLGLIVMTVIPAIFVVTGACIAVDAVFEAKIIRIYSRASVLAEEVLSSIRTVQAFYAQRKMVRQYDEYLRAAQKIGNKKSFHYGVLFSTQFFCVFSAIALAFWQGFRMYQDGEISDVGTVFTVVLSVTLAATAISGTMGHIEAITQASSAASELFAVIDKRSLLDPLEATGQCSSDCKGNLIISGVSFAYPSRPTAQVLKGINLKVEAGKTLALVGASGSGKSTIVGLLERWYLPSAGRILLDGKPLEEYNVKWLRSQIGLVQQEPTLFRGTVYHNVASGFSDHQRSLPDDEKMQLVREACRSSNADAFIEDLPEGYQTQVGERASTLSGGQRQRIAIARSIVSDPKILLLDEATSALDPKAERVVQDALSRVSVNRTTLIIAHKLSTIKAADSIAVVSNGIIVEQGTHQELIDMDGHYAALVRAQDLGTSSNQKDEIDNEKFIGETALARPTLEKVQSKAFSNSFDPEKQHQRAGTAGYSLIKCIWILFSEHKSLYWCFAIQACGCIIGGGSYPAQAILFSRLLTVFQLTGSEARSKADFYSLLFFVVALANLLAYFAIGWT